MANAACMNQVVSGAHATFSLGEIKAAICDLGYYFYGESGWGVTWTQWNTHRPSGLPSARTIEQHCLGTDRSTHASSAKWSQVLTMLGLQSPTYSMALACARRMGQQQEAEVVFLSERNDSEGLPVIPSALGVRQWDIKNHRYRITGVRQVYMVR